MKLTGSANCLIKKDDCLWRCYNCCYSVIFSIRESQYKIQWIINQSYTCIHKYCISIHLVLRAESQESVNSEKNMSTDRESLEREQIYPLSLKPQLMFRLIGLFTLTAQCICIFSHFVPVILSHDKVLPGWGVHEAWRKLAGFQKENRKWK